MHIRFHTIVARIHERHTLPIVAVCLMLIAASLAVAFQFSGPQKALGFQGIPLPGQQLWTQGGMPISSYLFGTTDLAQESIQPNIETSTAIQRTLKNAGVTIVRTDFPDNATDTTIDKRLQTIKNITGATCLGTIVNPANIAFDLHLVQRAGNTCSLWEIGLAPDANKIPSTTYIAQWTTLVPQLRKLNASIKVMGPATATENHPYLDAFLKGAKQANVLPDAVSFHWFPCSMNISQSICAGRATAVGGIVRDAQALIQQENLGSMLPIAITAWNAQIGLHPSSYVMNAAFMSTFTTSALTAMAESGVVIANQVAAASGEGGGALDMVDAKTAQARAQLVAMQTMMQVDRHCMQIPTTMTPIPGTSIATSTPTANQQGTTCIACPTSTATSASNGQNTPSTLVTCTPTPCPTGMGMNVTIDGIPLVGGTAIINGAPVSITATGTTISITSSIKAAIGTPVPSTPTANGVSVVVDGVALVGGTATINGAPASILVTGTTISITSSTKVATGTPTAMPLTVVVDGVALVGGTATINGAPASILVMGTTVSITSSIKAAIGTPVPATPTANGVSITVDGVPFNSTAASINGASASITVNGMAVTITSSTRVPTATPTAAVVTVDGVPLVGTATTINGAPASILITGTNASIISSIKVATGTPTPVTPAPTTGVTVTIDGIPLVGTATTINGAPASILITGTAISITSSTNAATSTPVPVTPTTGVSIIADGIPLVGTTTTINGAPASILITGTTVSITSSVNSTTTLPASPTPTGVTVVVDGKQISGQQTATVVNGSPASIAVNGMTVSITSSTKVATGTPTVGVTQCPLSGSPTGLIAWSAFDGGGQRLGANTSETTITLATVAKLRQIYRVALPKPSAGATTPTIVDSSPVELPQVTIPNVGVKNLLFFTSTDGRLIALDAATGQSIWQSKALGSTKITTSSPAIDASRQYIYSYSLDGKVHKYAVSTGQEIVTGGWPATITLMPNVEKGSSALNIANGYLYATISGYVGDAGNYIGHAVAVNLATGKTTVFNALCANIHILLQGNTCSQIQAGIWARGGVIADASPQNGGTGNVFLTTGNGAYNANAGGANYGDSIIELSPDLTKVIDTYTPSNFATLQQGDLDLGSTAPVLLPAQNNQLLLIQFGKDQTVRLINRQNMSGQGGPNKLGGEVQSLPLGLPCSVVTQPAVTTNPITGTTVFVATNCGFAAFKVGMAGGKGTLTPAFQTTTKGSSPFVVGGLVFVQSNGALLALDPARKGQIVWSSAQNGVGGTIGHLHWQSPLIVNGTAYVVDNDGNLSAYGPSAPGL